MPVHDASGSNQHERLPPSRPERSQRHPEQLVQGSQASARPLRVQRQQLLAESQVFQDEVLAGAKRADDPPEEMSKRHNHAGTTRILTIRRACGAARRVIFTGDLPGSNPRLWSDAEQSGSNPPGWKKFAVPRCLRRASSGIRHSVDCISDMREGCRP